MASEAARQEEARRAGDRGQRQADDGRHGRCDEQAAASRARCRGESRRRRKAGDQQQQVQVEARRDQAGQVFEKGLALVGAQLGEHAAGACCRRGSGDQGQLGVRRGGGHRRRWPQPQGLSQQGECLGDVRAATSAAISASTAAPSGPRMQILARPRAACGVIGALPQRHDRFDPSCGRRPPWLRPRRRPGCGLPSVRAAIDGRLPAVRVGGEQVQRQAVGQRQQARAAPSIRRPSTASVPLTSTPGAGSGGCHVRARRARSSSPLRSAAIIAWGRRQLTVLRPDQSGLEPRQSG